MPPIPYTEATGPDLMVRSWLGHDDDPHPEVCSLTLAEFFEANADDLGAHEQAEIIFALANGLTYRGGGGAAPPAKLERLYPFKFTQREIEVLRAGLEIAYADDDAPIYDRPEGSAEVAGLYRLLGGLRGVAFPTSGPSTVR